MHDLPAPAVLSIISYARGSRYIPGTNKYAAVCKAWRDVDSTTSNQLQLHLKQTARTKKEVRETRQWLLQHGKHVFAFELVMKPKLSRVLLDATSLCSNLHHLSIQGVNSLVHLLAAEVQLPRLQHLTACLDLFTPWPLDPSKILLAPGSEAAGGVYPLQQACPGLVELHLSLDVSEPATDGQSYTFGSLEELLPQLLPPTLQQLVLHCPDDQVTMGLAALTHLTALRHLGCSGIDVSPDLPLMLPKQCKLSLHNCLSWGLQPFRDRLTALVLDTTIDDASAVQHLTRLTSLAMFAYHKDDEQALLGESISHLTALKQLQLCAVNVAAEEREVPVCLQHVTSLASLSHLEVRTEGYASRQLLAAVGKLTQLSSLSVTPFSKPDVVPVGLGGLQLAAQPQAAGGGALAVLQGLVGLRQLELSAALLLEHPTGWLSCLTQLALLAVDCVEVQQQWPAWDEQLLKEQQQQVAAGCVAALAPRLQAVSFARLVQVVLYVEGGVMCEVVPSLLPGVSSVVQARRVMWKWDGEPSCFRPMAPFLRLPGVWELLG